MDRRRLLVVFIAALTVCSLVPMGCSETTSNDDTLRELSARWMWGNLTSMQVNSTFPYSLRGSSSSTTTAEARYLAGGILALQAQNNSAAQSYLEKANELCEWLDERDYKKDLFHRWDESGQAWVSPIATGTASQRLMEFAVYANISAEWQPLLQETTSVFIARTMNLTDSSYRCYSSVNYDDSVSSSTCGATNQGQVIEALTLAANVLDNATIRDIAYRLIVNYTLGSVNLPFHRIDQAGAAVDTFCKEDENYGRYTLAMATYYHYFPNTTIRERIRTVTQAFYQYGWNATNQRWNYKTNANTGAVVEYVSVHGFGYTNEAMLQSYLICSNATWLNRISIDMMSMMNHADVLENGVITHSTSSDVDADDHWNVAARRTFNIFYNFNYTGFYRNSTYLNWSNWLFANASMGHNRTYLWNYKIDASDFTDWSGAENTPVQLMLWLQYVNRTTVTVNTLYDLYTYYGAPLVGNVAFENVWRFYGVYDEDTGLLQSAANRAVNVTAYYDDGSHSVQFEVNSSYVYRTGSIPLYFYVDTSSPREYWLEDAETSGSLYIFDDSLTSYTITFLDWAGVLEDNPFIVAQRFINGSLVTVEKRRVDAEQKLQASLQTGTKYTLIVQGASTYIFGDVLMTSTTSLVLTLKGIEFPKETLLVYRYVQVYAVRYFATPTGNITVQFQDLNAETTKVYMYFNYKNGTQAHNANVTMTGSTSFTYSWTSAANATDYALDVDIDHTRYGVYEWRQYFPREGYGLTPWGLDFLGTSLPFATSVLIPSFLILFVAGCFTVINAEVGAFMAVVMAIALSYLGWIAIAPGLLITAFSLAVLMALMYAKRRITT